jgi:hypothetical protein
VAGYLCRWPHRYTFRSPGGQEGTNILITDPCGQTHIHNRRSLLDQVWQGFLGLQQSDKTVWHVSGTMLHRKFTFIGAYLANNAPGCCLIQVPAENLRPQWFYPLPFPTTCQDGALSVLNHCSEPCPRTCNLSSLGAERLYGHKHMISVKNTRFLLKWCSTAYLMENFICPSSHNTGDFKCQVLLVLELLEAAQEK